MATSDEEHAVSIDMLGPRRSRKCERRLASTLCSVPVSVRASIALDVAVLQLGVVVVVAGDEDARADCRSAARATDRHRQALRLRLPETDAAAGPSARLREAGCRSSRHRTHRSARGTRRTSSIVLPAAAGSGSYQLAASHRSSGTSRTASTPSRSSAPVLSGSVCAWHAARHADDGDGIGAQDRPGLRPRLLGQECQLDGGHAGERCVRPRAHGIR